MSDYFLHVVILYSSMDKHPTAGAGCLPGIQTNDTRPAPRMDMQGLLDFLRRNSE